MYARILLLLSALTLATPATAQIDPYQPYTSPPWDWMTELQEHIDEPDYPLWQYTRGTIAGATAMGTLGNNSVPMICMPTSTSNFDLLFALGAFLLDNNLISEPTAILELVAPLAALNTYPCNLGQAL